MKHSVWTRIWAVACLCALAMGGAGAAETTAKVRGSWSVEAEYHNVGIEEVDETVREWLSGHIRRQVSASAELTVHPDNPEPQDWNMAVVYERFDPSFRVLGYVFTTVMYTPSQAHPMTLVDTLFFDLSNGKRLTLDRIFAKPETALRIMAERAPALTREYLASAHPGEAVGDGDWFEEGFAPEADNYAAFILEPGGLRVRFQRYQVLPYAWGSPSAFFPLEMLAPAGPDRELWEPDLRPEHDG